MNCIAQEQPQPVLSQSNAVVKFGGTLATLIDNNTKRKTNDQALESRTKVRSIQNDHCDNLSVKRDRDDTITLSSLQQSPFLGNGCGGGDCGGGGRGGGGGGDDDDDGDDNNDYHNDNNGSLHAPLQGSQLHLPPENFSLFTEAPSSQTCLA